ncbi:MAG: RNA polymerase sigma-70 factor [Bacteroidales bacterium]|jgi:RNA polymerase sigma-70 factor (ECF subfamily)|nr:RNA polymerase sigma-70 factor [Bacteroidales bacterium]
MDSKEFDTFFVTYYNMLCAYARQFVCEEDAKEIVQELMAWFWQNHENLVVENSLKSYLFKAVKHRALNLIYRNKTYARVRGVIKKKYSIFEDPDCYLAEELAKHIESVLDTMQDEYRTAFEMNRFQNLTYSRIAQILGVSVQTVGYRITQALKIFKEKLKDYLPGR